MMAMFVACQSVQDKAKAYTEDIAAAFAAGDQEKAQKLGAEAAEWYAGLSDEDKAALGPVSF
jgi:phosphoribosyl-ATP pyrophosphohydrolase